MKFKPFLDKYNFNEETLTMSFPKYLHKPIEVWLFKVLSFSNMTTTIYPRTKCLGQGLVDELQIVFREVFPSKWNEAIYFIFDDKDRFANFLAFCLQNFSNRSHADRLEEILSKGGSGLEVIKIKKESSDFDKGVYDLVERVSLLVKEKSNKALLSDSLLEEAWSFCYSRNPDYEKVVSKSCDF